MRKSLQVSLALATLVAAGCGGSGSYTYTPPSVTGSTTLAPTSATATTTVPVATDPTTGLPVAQTTTLTYTDPTTGQQVTGPVLLPAGQSVSPGDTLALIPKNFPVPIFTTGSAAAAQTRAFIPNEVYLSTDSGATYSDTKLQISNGIIVGNGTLKQDYIALVVSNATPYDFYVSGPFNITSGGQSLTVKNGFDLHFEHFGIQSFPNQVDYVLPANSTATVKQSLATSKITLYFAKAQDGGASANVMWTSDSGAHVDHNYDTGDLTSVKKYVLLDPQVENTDPIPTSGITSVTLSVGTVKHGSIAPPGR